MLVRNAYRQARDLCSLDCQRSEYHRLPYARDGITCHTFPTNRLKPPETAEKIRFGVVSGGLSVVSGGFN